jgi:hypothetical protein
MWLDRADQSAIRHAALLLTARCAVTCGNTRAIRLACSTLRYNGAMALPPVSPGLLTAVVGWFKGLFAGISRRRADRKLLLARLHRNDEYRHYVSPHGAIVWRSVRDENVYLCVKCFEDGHHYVLQHVVGAVDTRHRCPSCNAAYQVVAPYKSPPPVRRPPGGPNSWMGN